MTNEKEAFHSYKALKEPLTVTIGDGEVLNVKGVANAV